MTNIRIFIIFLTLPISLQLFAQVKVRGYYKKDGTYVRPHYRSNPDGNPYNNWSYPRNTNPYTGKTATGNPNTYLENYHNRSSSSSSYSYPSTTYSAPSSSSYNSTNTSYNLSYYVTANRLNVRSGPSTNYSVIGSLSKAENVKVIYTYSNGWKKVQYNYYDFDSYS
ncbi:SH3 domain-containing protein [Aquimarina algicola]|uniref:SH3 domain-containing protein n=1 Tax=Aquimarina algicola TaxID=2589995 RepID=A0A504J2W1_9FLAO|nr:SH3 domain-containing protein [Aquimarina algicola]TPN82762.1 SH3 domain-containing protein [Aquimarina algicola]